MNENYFEDLLVLVALPHLLDDFHKPSDTKFWGHQSKVELFKIEILILNVWDLLMLGDLFFWSFLAKNFIHHFHLYFFL